jgi:BlaR1 peptidase M56
MSDAVFAFLVNGIWQAAVIGGAGLLLGRFLPPRQRFVFLALTSIACVAAPAFTLLAPAHAAAPLTAATILPPRAMSPLVLLYLAGLAIAAMRYAILALRARSIAASSAPLRGRLRVSARIDGPVTIGRFVYLPPAIVNDRALLASAVAHEHAHVRRNDYALHIAMELLALPLYFHPVVLLLRRAIAEAREMACDAEAAERRGRRRYARSLVAIAAMCSRTRLAIGMGGTALERRVQALLRAGAGGTPAGQPAGRRRSVLLLLIAAACTRFNAAPAALHGQWSLIREASTVRYDAFVQTIEQGPSHVSVRQQRLLRGRTMHVAWSVVTDGVTRPLDGYPGVRGSAEWKDGRLHLEMNGPGAHRERAVAFIRDDRLICDVETERGRIHSEFRRVER